VGGLYRVMDGEKGKEEPPYPEPFDGAPPVTEAADKQVPLYVGTDDHLDDQYARCSSSRHQTFLLFAVGNAG
jgi:hypothetical protein